MRVRCSLLLNNTGDTESILTSLWNNLVRAMAIMNGGKLVPPTDVVSVADIPLHYKTYEFDLRLDNPSPWINVSFVYESVFVTKPEEILDTVVSMTSALEYVIGRTGCLEIEEWFVFYGNTVKTNHDVGVDSMADILGSTKEFATDLFERKVEPKLDEIEGVCL